MCASVYTVSAILKSIEIDLFCVKQVWLETREGSGQKCCLVFENSVSQVCCFVFLLFVSFIAEHLHPQCFVLQRSLRATLSSQVGSVKPTGKADPTSTGYASTAAARAAAS